MKSIIILLIAIISINGSIVDIKRDKVIVKINGEEHVLLKGDKYNLNPNETICFEKGKGKLVIDNKIQITSKSRNKCYTNSAGVDSESLLNKANAYLDSSEDSVAGMTRGLPTKGE